MKIKLLLILLFAGCSRELLSNPIVPIMTDTVKLSTYLAKAKVFSKSSEFDSAIYYYTSASNLYILSGDTANSLKCYYSITKQISAEKKDAEALNFLIETGKKHEDWFKGHPLQEAEYQYIMGEKYTDNQKFDSAVLSYNRSLPLWFRNGKDSVKQIKDVYKAISYVYSQTGQYDSTIFYDQKLLNNPADLSNFKSANYNGMIVGLGIGIQLNLNKHIALDLRVLPEYYFGTDIKSKGETNYAIKKFNNFLLINSFGINYYFNKK